MTLLRGTAFVLACGRLCPSRKGLDGESEPFPTGCVALGRSLCPLSHCLLHMKILMLPGVQSGIRLGTGRVAQLCPTGQVPDLVGCGEKPIRNRQLATVLSGGRISTPWESHASGQTQGGGPTDPSHTTCPPPGHKPGCSVWPQMDWSTCGGGGNGSWTVCHLIGHGPVSSPRGLPTFGVCDLCPNLVSLPSQDVPMFMVCLFPEVFQAV